MRILNLLSGVISPIIEEFSDEFWCDSTEDLMARIQEVNNLSDLERKGICIFSMDAKALYPSLEIVRTSKVIGEIIRESTIELKNVDTTELARYLSYLLDERKIEQYGLDELVMRRRTNLGRRPVVTGEE